MTDIALDVPSDWSKQPAKDQLDNSLVGYQYTTDDKTTVIVSVLWQREDKEKYMLRLSTSDLTSSHVRGHDYPIEEYDSRETAITGAESFIEYLSIRLQERSVSSHDPEIVVIQDAIQEFIDDRLVTRIRCFIRRFRDR